MSSFALFSLLPTELRLKIWNLNLPGPRIVPIHYTYTSSDSTTPTPHDGFMVGCTSIAQIPANLHTNHESRREALRSYELSFKLQYSQAKAFFNPTIDVLYFGPKNGHLDSFKNFYTAGTMMAHSDRSKVTRFAVHEDLFYRSEDIVSSARIIDFWEILERNFENVQQVVVVTRDRGTRHCRLRWCNLVAEIQYSLDEVVAQGRKWEVPVWDIVTLPEKGQDLCVAEWDAFTLTQKDKESHLPEWPFGRWRMKIEQPVLLKEGKCS